MTEDTRELYAKLFKYAGRLNDNNLFRLVYVTKGLILAQESDSKNAVSE